MILRTALAALILASVLTACSDIYRDPCGYVRAPGEAATVTETTVRTKNKALGAGTWTTTYFPELLETVPRTRGSKCD